MKRNALEIYALAACLVSMVFLLVSSALSSIELLRTVLPSVTVGAYAYERSASDERYLASLSQNQPAPPASEVPRLRREALESALRTERRNASSSFVQLLPWVLAAGVAFRLHWKIGRRERLNAIVFNA
jgi:hypothetical protein